MCHMYTYTYICRVNSHCNALQHAATMYIYTSLYICVIFTSTCISAAPNLTATHCNILNYVLQCVAVCCSVLQCVAVCCSVLQ